MNRIVKKNKQRVKRKKSIRKKIYGTVEKPRMSVFRSNRFIYIQVIDDLAGNTLAAVNNCKGEFASIKSTVADAGKLGEAIGQKLKEKKIGSVVFDRNGYRYHGVVKAVADGVRKAGIEL